MLLFGTDKYLNGCLCVCRAHRKLLQLNGLESKIDLVLMCDTVIYDSYRQVLEKFVDHLVVVKLDSYSLAKNYQYKSSKYDWLAVSQKVLFMDLDILPVSGKLYEIFEMKTTPAFSFNRRYNEISGMDYRRYLGVASAFINGGLVLLSPNKKDFEDYFAFVRGLSKEGELSGGSMNSGPDETTLFYYYVFMKKVRFSFIARHYTAVPWVDLKKGMGGSGRMVYRSYNYLSFRKPWKSPQIFMWPEEYIWRQLFFKVLREHKELIDTLLPIFVRDELSIYLQMDANFKEASLNLEYLNDCIRDKIAKLVELLEDDPKLVKVVEDKILKIGVGEQTLMKLYIYGNIVKTIDDFVVYPKNYGLIGSNEFKEIL